MRTLTYWCCPSTDSRAYNVRARTRKEAMAKRAAVIAGGRNSYGVAVKVSFRYEDMIDLLNAVLGEGSPEWNLPIIDDDGREHDDPEEPE